MGIRLLAAASVLGPAALLACARGVAPPSTGQGQTVTITATCTGADVQVGVAPWRGELEPGDSITWTLVGDADSFEISNRTARGKWPFTEGLPYRGNPGAPKRVSGMKPNPRGEYRYAITLMCTADGQPRRVVIDPDMWVK